MTDEEYDYLKEQILRVTGIDLESYKSQQMRRRLDGFLSRIPGSGVGPYCEILQKDPEAQQRLKDFLTINVSEFFRDNEQFHVLKTKILPELISKNPSSIKIWSAGCSIGAEPYSIAMILDEINPQCSYRILATDLDQTILAQAKAGGPYKEADLKNVNKLQLTKYFTHTDRKYTVVDKLKSKIDFRQQNLLKANYPNGFDLIICRNVVIYFTEEAKREINQGFYNSLKDNGILFVGGTETLLDAQELGFKRLVTSFYTRVPVARSAPSLPKERLLRSPA